jgi:maltooligosyltrehalose trehalohydrolase
MTAFLLLAPGTPMLFQGQEFGATTPFLYFADADAERAKLLVEGRAKFLAQFPSLALPEMQKLFAQPAKRETFERGKLDFSERERNQPIYQLHQDLLRLRRDDPIIHQQPAERLHGATLGADAFLMRYSGDEGDDRLLIFNFGRDLHYWPAPQPLLAPPWGARWQLLWSSEEPAYGGTGTPALDTPEGWRIPGEAAVVLQPVDAPDEDESAHS